MKKYTQYLVVMFCGIIVFILQFNFGKSVQPYTYYQVYLDDETIGVIESKEELEKHISNQGNIIQAQVFEYQHDVEIIDSVYGVMKKTINYHNTNYSNYIALINLRSIYDELNKYVDAKGKIIGENYTNLESLYNKLSTEYRSETALTNDEIINYDLLLKRLDNSIKRYEKVVVDYLYANRDVISITSSEYDNLEEYYNNKLNEKNYSDYLIYRQYVNDNEIYLHTNNVYEPLGINVQKVSTYDKNIQSIEEVYNKIIDRKPCTIEGYQFRIKSLDSTQLSSNLLIGTIGQTDYKDIHKDSSDDLIIYVTDKQIFNDAIDEIASVFVGHDAYEAYKNNTQKKITTTGTYINNVYLNNEITVKKTNISVKEKIYTDSSSLASFLLYGNEIETKTVFASSTDTVDGLAYKNGISVEEFLLSNPTFTSIDNMFYDGQPITITKLNPKIGLIVEESQVRDMTVNYNTIEKFDSKMTVGSEYVEQAGEKGIVRVSQKVQKINGAVINTESLSNETIKAPKDRIILLGTKTVPNIGSVRNWGWPTTAYSISSYFGYRTHPVTGKRGSFHSGLDIPNRGGAPVFASNNGTIIVIQKDSSYGNHIIIDHNNGYYTLYAHMRSFAKGLKVGSVVARGQTIGYVGHTGSATGDHVHFEIRVGSNKHSNSVNPLPYLNR